MLVRAIGEDSFGIAQYQAAKEAMMLLERSLREGSPKLLRQRTSFHRRGRGGTPGCVAVPGGRIYNAPPPGSMWRERRGAGAVDRGGLENRCTLMGTEGSNPSLSANTSFATVCLRPGRAYSSGTSRNTLFGVVPLYSPQTAPDIWVEVWVGVARTWREKLAG